jgi:hypothetical protein
MFGGDFLDFSAALEQAAARGVTRAGFFAYALAAETKTAVLANPILAEYLAGLERMAARYRQTPLPELTFSQFRRYDDSGNRLGYEAQYFDRRGRLLAFALLAWLHGRAEDIAALEDVLWAICGEYSWALPAHMSGRSLDPAHPNEAVIDLFAAETGFALAEIGYLLGGRLSPIVVERARRAVQRRIFDAYLQHDGPQAWELMANNWCAVCAGSLGCATLYLMEDDTQLAALLARLAPTFERFLSSFAPDGACLEGLNYWTYGVSFYVAYADLLHRRTAGAIDLLAGERFAAIAEFQHKCYFPGGRTLSFADGQAHDRFRLGLTSYLAQRFAGVYSPPLACAMSAGSDLCFRFAPALRDLLWADQETLAARPLPADLCCALPAAQWLLCRGPGGALFAAKGGRNDEPHNHNDVGHFIYGKGGEALLVDLGAGEYTKDYFGDGRYTVFCNRSISHSVPLVNGREQGAGAAYAAAACRFVGEHAISLDLAPAYPCAELLSLVRTLAFDPATAQVTLSDSYQLAAPLAEVRERFVTLHPPQVVDGVITIAAGDAACTIRGDGSESGIVVSTHPHADHHGEIVTVYTIDYLYTDPPLAFEVHFVID